MRSLYRIKESWYQEKKVLLGGCGRETRALLLFCMQQNLRVAGFLKEKETEFHYLPVFSEEELEEGTAVARSAEALMEQDPQAGLPGCFQLRSDGWEEEWKRLVQEGVPEEKIFVDIYHLENLRGYYIVVNPDMPMAVQRFHERQIQSRYLEGKAIYGSLASQRDTQFVFPGWWGKGDTVLMASLMESYKKERGIANLVMLAARGHEEIIRFFPAVDGILTLSQDSRKALETYIILSEKYVGENLVWCGFSLAYCGYGKNWSNLTGKPTMLGIFRKALLLPQDAGLCFIPDCFLSPARADTQALLEELEREEAVLVIPQANGLYQILDMDPATENSREMIWAFLERLCEGWASKGKKVYCNIGGKKEPCLKGAVPLSLSIPDLLSVSRGFQLIYTVRTGLADILALGGNKMRVLNHKAVTRNLQMFRDATDLRLVNPRIVNDDWSPEGQDALLEEIIKGGVI